MMNEITLPFMFTFCERSYGTLKFRPDEDLYTEEEIENLAKNEENRKLIRDYFIKNLEDFIHIHLSKTIILQFIIVFLQLLSLVSIKYTIFCAASLAVSLFLIVYARLRLRYARKLDFLVESRADLFTELLFYK